MMPKIESQLRQSNVAIHEVCKPSHNVSRKVVSNTMIKADVEIVTRTFHEACFGTSLTSQQNAMKSIQDYENHNGIILSLVYIIEQSTKLKSEIRLLASISLKNAVSRRWVDRGKNSNVVTNQEKGFLKTFFITYLDERENKVSLQLAICASKVARHDWPNEWPTLFPDLFHAFECNTTDIVKQRRILYIFHECIRELSEKNIPATKLSLSKASVDIFSFFSPIWSKFCQLLLDSFAVGETDLSQVGAVLEHLYIITRILSKALEKGYIEIDSSNTIDLGHFYSLFVGYFERFLSVLNFHEARNPSIVDSEDFELETNDDDVFSLQFSLNVHTSLISNLNGLKALMNSMATIPTILQKEYPLELGRFLGAFLEFYQKQLFAQYNYSDQSLLENKVLLYPTNFPLCISAVIFLSHSISCQKYIIFEETNQTVDGSYETSSSSVSSNIHHAASIVRDTFFNETMLVQVFKLTVHRLLRYSRSELEDWKSCSELFYLSQQDLSEVDNLKTSVESLFLGLLEKSPEFICRYIISFLHDSETQFQMIQPTAGEDLIYFYNNIYLCCGLAASTLSQYMSCVDWVNSIIGPILSSLLQHSSLGILTTAQHLLRSRLFWLLSCFMYQFNSAVIADILNLVHVALTSSNSDAFCLLTAIETLQAVLKSDLFQPAIHSVCLPPMASALCVVMTERLYENEAKLICVNALGDLVEYIHPTHLLPLMTQLWSYFGNMWRQCDESDPLKSSILETIERIISSAGSHAHSEEMYAVTLPMIYAATPGNIESSHLALDGINLWLSLVRSIPVGNYNQQFNQLYNARYAFLFENDELGENYEDMKDIMLITEACIISGGQSFLSDCSQQFQAAFSKVLCQSPPRVVPYIIRPIECALLVFPTEALMFLYQSGFLFIIARACSASIPSLSGILTDFMEADVALISYLSVLARLCLCSSNSLRELSEVVAGSIAYGIATGNADFNQSNNGHVPFTQQDANVLLFGWLRLLIDKFDSVGYSSGGFWRRRLWALALLSLYPSQDPILVDMFPEILNIAIDVIYEERAEEGQEKASRIVDLLISKEEDLSGWIDESSASATESVADPSTIREKESIFYSFTPYVMNDIVTYASVYAIAKEKLSTMRGLHHDSQLHVQLESIVGDSLQIFN